MRIVIKQNQQNKYKDKLSHDPLKVFYISFYYPKLSLLSTPYKTKNFTDIENRSYGRISTHTKSVPRKSSERDAERFPACIYGCTFETNAPFISDESLSPNRDQEKLELMHSCT